MLKQTKKLLENHHMLPMLDNKTLFKQYCDYYKAIKKDPTNLDLALFGEDLLNEVSKRCLTNTFFKKLNEKYKKHNSFIKVIK